MSREIAAVLGFYVPAGAFMIGAAPGGLTDPEVSASPDATQPETEIV